MSETKNPFMKPVDESIFLFIPSISDKQAEYAAHAINQHEKLVAALTGLLDNYRHNHGEGLGIGPVQKAKAALLKEEKT